MVDSKTDEPSPSDEAPRASAPPDDTLGPREWLGALLDAQRAHTQSTERIFHGLQVDVREQTTTLREQTAAVREMQTELRRQGRTMLVVFLIAFLTVASLVNASLSWSLGPFRFESAHADTLPPDTLPPDTGEPRPRPSRTAASPDLAG